MALLFLGKGVPCTSLRLSACIARLPLLIKDLSQRSQLLAEGLPSPLFPTLSLVACQGLLLKESIVALHYAPTLRCQIPPMSWLCSRRHANLTWHQLSLSRACNIDLCAFHTTHSCCKEPQVYDCQL